MQGLPGGFASQVPSWLLRCCNMASPFGSTGQLGGAGRLRDAAGVEVVKDMAVVWHFHGWFGKCASLRTWAQSGQTLERPWQKRKNVHGWYGYGSKNVGVATFFGKCFKTCFDWILILCRYPFLGVLSCFDSPLQPLHSCKLCPPRCTTSKSYPMS